MFRFVVFFFQNIRKSDLPIRMFSKVEDTFQKLQTLKIVFVFTTWCMFSLLNVSIMKTSYVVMRTSTPPSNTTCAIAVQGNKQARLIESSQYRVGRQWLQHFQFFLCTPPQLCQAPFTEHIILWCMFSQLNKTSMSTFEYVVCCKDIYVVDTLLLSFDVNLIARFGICAHIVALVTSVNTKRVYVHDLVHENSSLCPTPMVRAHELMFN